MAGNSRAQDKEQQRKRRRRMMAVQAYLGLRKGERHLPPLIRAVLGLLLVIMGIFGFLPILGFWMIPLGLALMATDIPPLKRWLRRRLLKWTQDNR